LANGRVIIEAVAPWVNAHFLYFAQLHSTCGFEPAAVFWFVGFGVAHGIGWFWVV
jgi:hypothetical protein